MVAGEADPILPQGVLRHIGDKLYEKRKQAALEVEQIVKALSLNQERVQSIIDKLVEDYAKSPQANNRKGGLLCLAAIAVGLGQEENGHFLTSIVPPVLESLRDHDSGVRYYGLEALYNIAKISRESFMNYFSDTFDSLFRLCADSENRVQNAAMILDNIIKDIVAESTNFDIEAFIPRLARFLDVEHGPHKRRFLTDWISLLQSVPNIDMLAYLPQLLHGMLGMLSDKEVVIRTAAANTLDRFLAQLAGACVQIEEAPDFVNFVALSRILVQKASAADNVTRHTALRWLNSFLNASEDSVRDMLSSLAEVIRAVLPCVSDPYDAAQKAAINCNNLLLMMDLGPHLGMGPVLEAVSYELSSQQEPTRLAALQWIEKLLHTSKDEVLHYWHVLMPALLDALTVSSDRVVTQALQVHAEIAQDERHFKMVLQALIDRFRGPSGQALLQRRGALIIRGLAGMLGGVKVFFELATILDLETDAHFASSVTQALNLLLLTAPELADLRVQLQHSLHDASAAALLRTLYSCWCHSACAALSVCMLAQAYKHVDAMIHTLAELPLDPLLLAQVDRFVMLIDSPIFTRLRLQLLAPERYPDLIRSMYSLLMLCPQSAAFHTLHARLSSVPTLALLKLNDAAEDSRSAPPCTPAPPEFAAERDDATSSGALEATPAASKDSTASHALASSDLPWEEMLQVFRLKQSNLSRYHEEQQHLPWMASRRSASSHAGLAYSHKSDAREDSSQVGNVAASSPIRVTRNPSLNTSAHSGHIHRSP